MKFRTEIIVPPAKNQVDYRSKLLLLGSCFSDNIGDKLRYHKFQVKSNPFGILFHPLAIEKLISRAIQNEKFNPEECVEQPGIWSHFDLHSTMNRPVKQELITEANGQLQEMRQSIKSASHLFITLGSAWVYTHLATDKIVANCHKFPQNQFSKSLLSIDQISQSLTNIIDQCKSINPQVNIVFTLSPVRHLKDGFVENLLSKAHLLSSVHQTIDSHQANYFPAYEILHDELRDYRFYKEDMIHPNRQAVRYIWEKFSTSWIHKDSYPTMKKISQIQQNLTHRPFDIHSENHQEFLNQTARQIAEIQKEFDFIKF